MTVPTSRATAELWTGLGPVPAEIQGFFDQTLLDNLPPDFVYMGYGLRRNIPANSGRSITWDRPNLLTVNTTAIPEYTTPEGQQFSTSYVQATIAEYGTHVPFSRRATHLGLIRDLTGKIRDVLSVNKKDTFDQLTRDALVAGTQVRYANGAGRTEVNTSIEIADIAYAVNLLNRANAKPISKRVEPSTGVGTRAINPAYLAFGHWDLFKDLSDLGTTYWLDAADYPDSSSRYPNEVGTIRNVGGRDVRVILSSNGKIWPSTGADSTGLRETTDTKSDIYALVIIAEGAYIETSINGKGQGVIVQPLGSGGAEDPFRQRGSIAWADYYVATIADDARIVRIECACE
jgi:N4-gp56 family major capsid protein